MLNSTMISPNQCTAARPSIGGFGQNIDLALGDGDSMVTRVLVASTFLQSYQWRQYIDSCLY